MDAYRVQVPAVKHGNRILDQPITPPDRTNNFLIHEQSWTVDASVDYLLFPDKDD